jgi:hypothetical protein
LSSSIICSTYKYKDSDSKSLHKNDWIHCVWKIWENEIEREYEKRGEYIKVEERDMRCGLLQKRHKYWRPDTYEYWPHVPKYQPTVQNLHASNIQRKYKEYFAFLEINKSQPVLTFSRHKYNSLIWSITDSKR